MTQVACQPKLVAIELIEDVSGILGDSLRQRVSRKEIASAIHDAIEKARVALQSAEDDISDEVTIPGEES